MPGTSTSAALGRFLAPSRWGTAVAAVVAVGCTAPPGDRVSRAFTYSGYSSAEWSGHRRWAEFVTMPDGVKIAVDVVLPTGYTGKGDSVTRFPVIFQYTPYGRSSYDPKTGDVPIPPNIAFFLRHGYAYLTADMRGTGSSDGWINLFDPAIRRDGKEIVDWIAAQAWSDGNVGMTGGSYVGWSQYAVASMKPKALKAIVPNVAAWDGFIGRPGGIFWESFLEMWSALAYSLNRSSVFPPFPIPPTPPVVDEDGDGDIRDEVPVDLDGDGWLHDDYAWPLENGPAPRYPDGVARREHHYLRALMQHAAHPNGEPGTFDGYRVFKPQLFRDTKRNGDGTTAPDQNWAWFPDVLASGVAVLHLAGWYDPFVRSAFEMHATMVGKLPSRIVARAAYHQGISKAHAEAIGVDSTDQALFGEMHLIEQLRWYDRWLKGIENGIEREPPVLAFVANEGWREETSWPVPGTTMTKLYLDSSRTLVGAEPATAGTDRYRADFSHSSGWGPPQDVAAIVRANATIGRPAPVGQTYYRNRAFMFLPPETPPYRTEADRKALTYTTTPLAADTRVLGHPIVRLWASSTAPDGDFFLYLEDVAPDGEAILVSEYQHRAGFARLRDNDEMIPGRPGIDIEPELPWHGFAAADYDPNVFAGGKVVEIVAALYPTGWLFRKGHSIRLSIAAADWPTFELHPALSPSNRPNDSGNLVPMVTIHRGTPTASSLELPVVAGQADEP
jgi:hypothetical protein